MGKKYKATLVRENVVDAEGDLFPAEVLKSLDGVQVPINLFFDNSLPQIGLAKVSYKQGVGCVVDLDIVEGKDVEGLVPCVGFRAGKMERVDDHFEYGGKIELISVGLCHANADKEIPPIGSTK